MLLVLVLSVESAVEVASRGACVGVDVPHVLDPDVGPRVWVLPEWHSRVVELMSL